KIIREYASDRDLMATACFNKSVALLNSDKVKESLEFANKALSLCYDKTDCSYCKNYRDYVQRIFNESELKNHIDSN
ncbi:MAG: hypothetical protein ACKOE6_02855, partial [Flammeovirgaceae bacterium]